MIYDFIEVPGARQDTELLAEDPPIFLLPGRRVSSETHGKSIGKTLEKLWNSWRSSDSLVNIWESWWKSTSEDSSWSFFDDWKWSNVSEKLGHPTSLEHSASTVPGAISCLPSRQSDCFVTMNLGGGDRMDRMWRSDVAGWPGRTCLCNLRIGTRKLWGSQQIMKWTCTCWTTVVPG